MLKKVLQFNTQPFCHVKMVMILGYVSLILVYVHSVFNFLMTVRERAKINLYLGPCVFLMPF